MSDRNESPTVRSRPGHDMSYFTSFAVLFLALFVFVVRCEQTKNDADENSEGFDEIFGNAVQEGRTFVHHAMKRLAFLVPLLMFKLGVMFTLLVVATLTSTKGLMVGSLLLALGVGHFIANKWVQPSHAHIAIPAAASAWPAPHFIDRSGVAGDYAHAQPYAAWRTK